MMAFNKVTAKSQNRHACKWMLNEIIYLLSSLFSSQKDTTMFHNSFCHKNASASWNQTSVPPTEESEKSMLCIRGTAGMTASKAAI
jgi:hypothetical protein